MPKAYTDLCQGYLPRPLRTESEYSTARQAIEPLMGFEDRLSQGQADYIEAVGSFIEAYDESRVKWPKSKPLETLQFLLEQNGQTGADLSRLLGADRTLGSKILRGERRLTVHHIQTLAKHWKIDPGVFLGDC